MDTLTRQTLNELLAVSGDTKLSVYLPTARQKELAPQNRIVLKNLATEAQRLLTGEGWSAVTARQLGEQIQALSVNEAFWDEADLGLVIFATAQMFRAFRLPRSFAPGVFVGPQFQVTPLLPLLTGDGNFLVLAVSQNQVRLLSGDRAHVRPVALETLPGNLAEALNFEPPEAMRQAHGSVSWGKGGRSTVFHGQGGAPDFEKTEVLEFFRQIDHALCDYLGDRRMPVVFAGVDSLFPLYRQANHYPHLESEHLSGNAESASPEQLQAAAWKIVAPRFAQAAEDAVERVLQLSGSERFVAEFSDVLRAAHHGEVETLLIVSGAQHWGKYHEATGRVEHRTSAEPHTCDLINLAVLQTLTHGGQVVEVDATRLPGHSAIVASLRYVPTVAGRPT